MTNRDPISTALARLLSPLMHRLFSKRPEDFNQIRNAQERYENWVQNYLKISHKEPSVVQSVFLWTLLIGGFALAFYLALARR